MAKEKIETAEILATLERLARLMRAGEHEGGLNPAQWEALNANLTEALGNVLRLSLIHI